MWQEILQGGSGGEKIQIYEGTGEAPDGVVKTYTIGFKPKYIDIVFKASSSINTIATYIDNNGTTKMKATHANGTDYTLYVDLVVNDTGFTLKQRFTGTTLNVEFVAIG